MRWNRLVRLGVPALVLLALVCLAASAEDKKDAKDKATLSGTWQMKGGQVKLEFIDKDVMKVYPHGDSDVIIVVCKYTYGKDGLVKAKISELEGTKKDMAKDKLPEGLEFSFAWRAKDATATLEDLKGENTDILKSHMEGEFEKK